METTHETVLTVRRRTSPRYGTSSTTTGDGESPGSDSPNGVSPHSPFVSRRRGDLEEHEVREAVQRLAEIYVFELLERASDDPLVRLAEPRAPDGEPVRAAHAFSFLGLDFEELVDGGVHGHESGR